MSGPYRLPALLWIALCLLAAFLSSVAAGVSWLGHSSASVTKLQLVLPLADRLGLPTSSAWLRLADLDPVNESRWLAALLESNPRHLPALLRYSLVLEFAGKIPEARHTMAQAVHYHRSFKSYMAALNQAARLGQQESMPALAKSALLYCPRDADAVYLLLDYPRMKAILDDFGLDRRRDYLRHLLGRQDLTSALDYSECLPADPSLLSLRLELCERLFWTGKRKQAEQLFTSLHSDFAQNRAYNLDFQNEPTSLGFDWRLRRAPDTAIEWRPGELSVRLEELSQSQDLLSILVHTRSFRHGWVDPAATGDLAGLAWSIERLDADWARVLLRASPGPARRFQIHGVKLR